VALLLRKLDRRSRWMAEAIATWLPHGDAPAPALHDFIDEQGKVSVWAVAEDQSNLPRVVAAIAATRESADVFDFVLFDGQAVSTAGARLEAAPGNSPDRVADQEWHRNLANVSAQRAARLVCAAFVNGERDRTSPKQIVELLLEAVNRRWLKLDDLKAGVKEKLQRTAAEKA